MLQVQASTEGRWIALHYVDAARWWISGLFRCEALVSGNQVVTACCYRLFPLNLRHEDVHDGHFLAACTKSCLGLIWRSPAHGGKGIHTSRLHA